MFRFIRRKIIEGIIKDVIKELPKYKINALNYFNEHKQELIEKVVEFIQKEVLKKILVLMAIVVLTSPSVLAQEPQQEIKNDQAYFTANLQKQPEKDNKQKIGNHFSFFVVNIQINGKINDTDSSNK